MTGPADPPGFADYQLSIYLAGLEGVKPETPISIEALEGRARELLDAEAYAYVAGSAGAEETADANREAFRRRHIVPRMLRDVARRELGTSLLGLELPAPLLLAPIGVLGIVHPDGELPVARAASQLGVPLVLSTVSSKSLEEVGRVMGDAPRWFQLYWPRSRDVTRSLVKRAADAGYRAVVATLDTRLLAWRERDLQNAYLPFLRGQGLANYFSDPAFRAELEAPPEQDARAAITHWAGSFSDAGQTWDDVAALRDSTKLPLLLKGILHPEDARLAVERGVDGIVVSNHGGRQVDGAIAALDALPGVVAAVDGRVPVLFDSGIRRGADVVKALALGAKAVLLGRPYVWGLAVDGEDGVRAVVRRLLAELDLTMALSGCRTLADVTPELLASDG